MSCSFCRDLRAAKFDHCGCRYQKYFEACFKTRLSHTRLMFIYTEIGSSHRHRCASNILKYLCWFKSHGKVTSVIFKLLFRLPNTFVFSKNTMNSSPISSNCFPYVCKDFSVYEDHRKVKNGIVKPVLGSARCV